MMVKKRDVRVSVPNLKAAAAIYCLEQKAAPRKGLVTQLELLGNRLVTA